ncbi:MAG: inorganic phosphate transporter [Acidothermus sp.]|nr:inorganic phosphate transporter [Acidothermus sp.]MCL6538142.1 inorganic phosphate transporter [Acidothermus sp.]
MEAGWLTIAALFAVVTGANDGAAIVASGLRVSFLRPLTALLVLVAGVLISPLLFGTEVAATLSHRLVTFKADGGRTAFALGLLAALLVVGVLTAMGRPTSLTVALIGGIAGAGLGYGLPVAWTTVGRVLVFGLLSPLFGGLVGLGLARMLRHAPPLQHMPLVMRVGTLLGYGLLALAYGANDGQKMLAVFAVAQSGNGHIKADALTLGLTGLCFVAGAAASLPRLASRLGAELLRVRPLHAMTAQTASAAAAFGSALAHAPVSMTQSLAASLVGSGASEGSRRVRWRAVSRLGMAWVVTLPASIAVSSAVAGLVHAVAG